MKFTKRVSSFLLLGARVFSGNKVAKTSIYSDLNSATKHYALPAYPSVPPTLGRQEKDLQSLKLKRFKYIDIKSATRNFRPDSILGEGGFGRVYKGWIDENTFAPAIWGSGLAVAIKGLDINGSQGHQEWLAELIYLGTLSHPNLLKLIGYCIEEEQRLLVYEYMPRGSLENHIFKRRLIPLSWNLRISIALGSAKGLAYLHSSEARVICRDFKTSNILLDSNYDAKLSDFGLAKDGPGPDNSHVSTRVMGTYGYAAPEYMATGRITMKSDVYGFGVVLLELLTGRRVINQDLPTKEQNLVSWAKPYLTKKDKILHVMDARIEGQYTVRAALAASSLALKCISIDPKVRPQADQVVKELEKLQDL